MRRVVVTGLGVVSSLGHDPDSLFSRLMQAESGIRLVSAYGSVGSHTGIAGIVDFVPRVSLPADQKTDNLDRISQFALAAATSAVDDAAFEFTEENTRRTGISLGTGMGATSSIEDAYVQVLLGDADRVKPLTILKVMGNAAASHVAIRYGLSGPNLSYFCACASSTVAIGEAARQIRHGYADAVIAGGTESILSYGSFKTWAAMRVLASIDPLDPATSCKPFSKNRSGLVLGEGAAMVMLEERESAKRRGARIYGELVGYGSSNDFTHITMPTVEGQAQAMTLALADAKMSGDDVDYINAHGTATALNDVTETRAIKQVFGAHAYRVPVSSTKSMHGHLLGGAGAMEFVIAMLAMKHQAIPPTAHLDTPDPECDLDYVPGQGRDDQPVACIMSNSFAFGGTNAVLIARADR